MAQQSSHLESTERDIRTLIGLGLGLVGLGLGLVSELTRILSGLHNKKTAHKETVFVISQTQREKLTSHGTTELIESTEDIDSRRPLVSELTRILSGLRNKKSQPTRKLRKLFSSLTKHNAKN